MLDVNNDRRKCFILAAIFSVPYIGSLLYFNANDLWHLDVHYVLLATFCYLLIFFCRSKFGAPVLVIYFVVNALAAMALLGRWMPDLPVFAVAIAVLLTSLANIVPTTPVVSLMLGVTQFYALIDAWYAPSDYICYPDPLSPLVWARTLLVMETIALLAKGRPIVFVHLYARIGFLWMDWLAWYSNYPSYRLIAILELLSMLSFAVFSKPVPRANPLYVLLTVFRMGLPLVEVIFYGLGLLPSSVVGMDTARAKTVFNVSLFALVYHMGLLGCFFSFYRASRRIARHIPVPVEPLTRLEKDLAVKLALFRNIRGSRNNLTRYLLPEVVDSIEETMKDVYFELGGRVRTTANHFDDEQEDVS